MIGSPGQFLQEIGTWQDSLTDISVRVAEISEINDIWKSTYEIVLDEQVIGTSIFQYIGYCDTIYFLSIELLEGANQGFMTRWLEYGEDLMREKQVRRATSSPKNYAVNVFNNAGWLPNQEDGLGAMAKYYTNEEL